MTLHSALVATMMLVGLGLLAALFTLYDNPLMEIYLSNWFIC